MHVSEKTMTTSNYDDKNKISLLLFLNSNSKLYNIKKIKYHI